MSKSKSSSNSMTRRNFLTAGAAISTFTIVPSHVLGRTEQTAPSDKLNVAGIGVGGQGMHDLESVQEHANIVALCDVDFDNAKETFEKWPDAKRYQDYRIMLDKQPDIDAVIIAVPDHNHAVITMEAMRRGKHVYTEKPLTHTVYEARALARAARYYKVATQMGNHGQASEETRRIQEVIWDGAIGPVHEVHVWTDRPNHGLIEMYWPQGIDRPQDTPPVPANLNWDLFIGPAPMRPYNPAYHPFVWRGWWDFGTGALGDIGCHRFDAIFRALKLGYPDTVQAVSTLVNAETYPSGSMVTYEFPVRGNMPPVTLKWYDGGLRPDRIKELDEGLQMGDNGILYVGEKGLILNNMLLPESLRNSYEPPAKTLPRSPGHHLEWINACKGGEPAGSNFDWAGPLTEVVLMGNIALRLDLREKLDRQILKWDPVMQQFSNLPEANAYLHKKYRDGWSL